MGNKMEDEGLEEEGNEKRKKGNKRDNKGRREGKGDGKGGLLKIWSLSSIRKNKKMLPEGQEMENMKKGQNPILQELASTTENGPRFLQLFFSSRSAVSS